MKVFFIFVVLLFSLFMVSWQGPARALPLGSRLFEGFVVNEVGDKSVIDTYSPGTRLIQLSELLFFDPINSQLVEFENDTMVGTHISITKRDNTKKETEIVAGTTTGINAAQNTRAIAIDAFIFEPKYVKSKEIRVVYVPSMDFTVLLVDDKASNKLTHLVVNAGGDLRVKSTTPTNLVGDSSEASIESPVPPFGITTEYDPTLRLRNIAQKVKYDFANQVLIVGKTASCVRALHSSVLTGTRSTCPSSQQESMDPYIFSDVETKSLILLTKMQTHVALTVIMC